MSDRSSPCIFISFSGRIARDDAGVAIPERLSTFLRLHQFETFCYTEPDRRLPDIFARIGHVIDSESDALVFFHEAGSDREAVSNDLSNAYVLGEVDLAWKRHKAIIVLRDREMSWRNSHMRALEKFATFNEPAVPYGREPNGEIRNVWQIGHETLVALQNHPRYRRGRIPPALFGIEKLTTFDPSTAVSRRGLLQHLLDELRTNPGSIVHLQGRSGAGKSYLLAELVAQLRRPGATPAFGVIAYFAAPLPWKDGTPGSEPIHRFTFFLAEIFESIGMLDVREILREQPDPPQLAAQLVTFLAGLPRLGRWLIILDDLHLADASGAFRVLVSNLLQHPEAFAVVTASHHAIPPDWGLSNRVREIQLRQELDLASFREFTKLYVHRRWPGCTMHPECMNFLAGKLAGRCFPKDLDNVLAHALQPHNHATVIGLESVRQERIGAEAPDLELLLKSMTPDRVRVLKFLSVFDEPVETAALKHALPAPGLPPSELAALVQELDVRFGIVDRLSSGELTLNERDRLQLRTLAKNAGELPEFHRCAADYYRTLHGDAFGACIPSATVAHYLQEFSHRIRAGEFDDAARRVTRWDLQLSPSSGHLLRFGRARDVKMCRDFLRKCGNLTSALDLWINHYQLGLAATRLSLQADALADFRMAEELATAAMTALAGTDSGNEISPALRQNDLRGATRLYHGLAYCWSRKLEDWLIGFPLMLEALPLNQGKGLEGNNIGQLASQTLLRVEENESGQSPEVQDWLRRCAEKLGSPRQSPAEFATGLDRGGCFETIAEWLGRAHRTNHERGDQRSACYWLTMRGRVLDLLDREAPGNDSASRAQQALEAGLREAEAIYDPIIRFTAHLFLGRFHAHRGNTDGARQHFVVAHSIAQSTLDAQGMHTASEAISRLDPEPA